jgi:hypothetical protein
MARSEWHRANSKPITIRGVEYPSRWAAAEALNVTRQNIQNMNRIGKADRIGLGRNSLYKRGISRPRPKK